MLTGVIVVALAAPAKASDRPRARRVLFMAGLLRSDVAGMCDLDGAIGLTGCLKAEQHVLGHLCLQGSISTLAQGALRIRTGLGHRLSTRTGDGHLLDAGT